MAFGFAAEKAGQYVGVEPKVLMAAAIVAHVVGEVVSATQGEASKTSLDTGSLSVGNLISSRTGNTRVMPGMAALDTSRGAHMTRRFA